MSFEYMTTETKRIFREKWYSFFMTEKEREKVFFQKLAEVCYKVYLEPKGY